MLKSSDRYFGSLRRTSTPLNAMFGSDGKFYSGTLLGQLLRGPLQTFNFALLDDYPSNNC
jgi:hypothetical protein